MFKSNILGIRKKHMKEILVKLSIGDVELYFNGSNHTYTMDSKVLDKEICDLLEREGYIVGEVIAGGIAMVYTITERGIDFIIKDYDYDN